MELRSIKYNDLPNKAIIVYFLQCIKDYLFPNFYNKVTNKEILYKKCNDMFSEVVSDNDKIRKCFFNSLKDIYNELLTDIEMTYNSDPACTSYEEVVITYPGINAIMTYRIAHILYQLNIPIIPRIMTEYSHSRTGIDIHPGAKIGNHFFIDHGTGIVIGETTIIGDYVKVYQGVTIGALSLEEGQKMKGSKRHPTIGNHVTIYANASILGGETIIGDNVTIGGNTFITTSIPPNTLVLNKKPELILKEKK